MRIVDGSGNLDLKKKGLRPDCGIVATQKGAWESRPEEKGIKTVQATWEVERLVKVGIST